MALESYIVPYCVATEPAHLEEPLSEFQSVVADREGTVEGVRALWDIDERDPESTRRKRSILQRASGEESESMNGPDAEPRGKLLACAIDRMRQMPEM